MLAGTPDEIAREREINEAVRSYEGLIARTALMLVNGEPPYSKVEEELADIVQILSIKVWRAVRAFDPAKWKGGKGTRHAKHQFQYTARDRYVNMCLRDAAKDIVKKKRLGILHIEDLAPASSDADAPTDKFHERFLSEGHDEVYGEVEDELPTLPNTLSGREPAVLDLMRGGYKQTEIAVMLNVSKRDVESAVRGIRTKLADWRPTVAPVPERDFIAA